MQAPQKDTAFALAGLGGFNAHGAGFLDAAKDRQVEPDLITATSGQIVVLAAWLKGEDLRSLLISPLLEHSPWAQIAVAFFGYPHVFRPAYPEALMRWMSFWPFQKDFANALYDRLLPAELYVPTRRPSDYAEMAQALDRGRLAEREHEIGIVFDAYDVESGRTLLHGNNKARELWERRKKNPDATRSIGLGVSASESNEAELLPITAEAVERALWLSFYGFGRGGSSHVIDGAYSRACIVAELHEFNTIYVARPLAQGWKRPPMNWFEVQDWQTEMWFSTGYKAEVDALHQINGLVKSGRLGAPYREVNIVEIAPNTPAGFFNFFIEREKIYNEAYADALNKF